MIGKSIDKFISPDKLKKCQMPPEPGINSKCREETVIMTSDGTLVPVQVTFRYLEQINGFNTVINDITSQKESENELNTILEDLKCSNEELERFAYVASHDLQEPLRTITSFTKLLECFYKFKLDKNADEFIDYILGAVKRMKQQIEGLLVFSRVATKGEEFKSADLNEVLKRTIGTLDTLINECNADITFDNLPISNGRSEQLQRVFQNLIANAVKFRK